MFCGSFTPVARVRARHLARVERARAARHMVIADTMKSAVVVQARV